MDHYQVVAEKKNLEQRNRDGGTPIQKTITIRPRNEKGGYCPPLTVRAHFNSDFPVNLGLEACCIAEDIYLAPGKESRLEHELVHAHQQRSGKVKATGLLNGIPINEDQKLEQDAEKGRFLDYGPPVSSPLPQVMQPKVGMEYQTVGGETNVFNINGREATKNNDHGTIIAVMANGVTMTVDGGDIEYVINPQDTPKKLKEQVDTAARFHKQLKNEYKKKPFRISQETISLEGIQLKKVKLREGNKEGKYLQVAEKNIALGNLENTAHPQATAGIRADRLQQLFLSIGNQFAQDSRELSKDEFKQIGLIYGGTRGTLKNKGTDHSARDQQLILAKAARKTTDYLDACVNKEDKNENQRKIITISDEDKLRVLGFLTLLEAYVQGFEFLKKKDSSNLVNAKNATPVMSRTSLFDLYEKTPHKEVVDDYIQQCFLKKRTLAEQDEQTLAKKKKKQTLAKKKKKQTLAKKKKKQTLDEKKKKQTLDEQDEQTLAGQLRIEWKKVSVKEWFNELKNYKSDRATKDPLSEFSGMSKLSNSDNKSLKRFGVAASTDIGMAGQYGALVEIRCLERGVPTERWGEIAEKVAKFVDNINK